MSVELACLLSESSNYSYIKKLTTLKLFVIIVYLYCINTMAFQTQVSAPSLRIINVLQEKASALIQLTQEQLGLESQFMGALRWPFSLFSSTRSLEGSFLYFGWKCNCTETQNTLILSWRSHLTVSLSGLLYCTARPRQQDQLCSTILEGVTGRHLVDCGIDWNNRRVYK